MDLDLLHHHARRYGQWAMNVSATEKLECQYRQNGVGGPWHYAYLLTKKEPGKRHSISKYITEAEVDRLIEAAFERAVA